LRLRLRIHQFLPPLIWHILGRMETQQIITARPVLRMPRILFSMAEAEALTGLSRSTLYRMIEAGKLRTVLHGRRRLVPAGELERLL
jgi:excisionase family DNA binding protein